MKEYQVDVYNVNNELVYEEKNMTCNDEQFDTFIKLLTNELVYGKKKVGEQHERIHNQRI